MNHHHRTSRLEVGDTHKEMSHLDQGSGRRPDVRPDPRDEGGDEARRAHPRVEAHATLDLRYICQTSARRMLHYLPDKNMTHRRSSELSLKPRFAARYDVHAIVTDCYAHQQPCADLRNFLGPGDTSLWCRKKSRANQGTPTEVVTEC